MIALHEHFDDTVREMGHEPSGLKGYVDIRNREQATQISNQFLKNHAGDFTTAFLNKDWVLFQTTSDNPFWVSDNPISFHNDERFGPYGNLGLLVPGIQIHLPISPTLQLVFWCKTVLQKLRREALEAHRLHALIDTKKLDVSNVDLFKKANDLQNKLAYSVSSLEGGAATSCVPDNVTFFNSLQVGRAERFIFSRQKNFELAKRMIRDHAHFKKGPRFKSN